MLAVLRKNFLPSTFEVLDLIWFGVENGYTANEIAAQLNLSEEQVKRVTLDIQQKKRTTEYLRFSPLQLELPH